MKKILFVGAEAMPFAATGGLGDVLGSLPAALAALPDTDVRVMLPLYGQVSDAWRAQMKDEAVFTVHLAWRKLYCGIKSLVRDGVTYYFIDNEYYFNRPYIYGVADGGIGDYSAEDRLDQGTLPAAGVAADENVRAFAEAGTCFFILAVEFFFDVEVFHFGPPLLGVSVIRIFLNHLDFKIFQGGSVFPFHVIT